MENEAATKPYTGQLPSFRLDGRVAVVTGASEGIGRSIALAFAAAGAQLALASRLPAPRLAETIRAIEEMGGKVKGYETDLRSLDSVRRLADDVLADFPAPAILVNAAGAPLTKRAFDVTEQDWDLLMDVDLKAIFFISVLFAKRMAGNGYGKIINLSSTYSESVGVGKSVYATAKAGVSHMTRALALEWAPLGIRVNALAPTTTVTPTRLQVVADAERSAWLLSRIPMGRFAQTEDLVGAALFLASEASDFVTGHTLYVDGGWHAGR